MSLQEAFSQQVLAFHAAIIDDCDRAARPDRTDAMALRLRDNALGLAKMQMAMLALARTDPAVPQPAVPQPTAPEPALVPAEPEPPEPEPYDPDRILAGDAMSRFVSRPLAPDESPHDV